MIKLILFALALQYHVQGASLQKDGLYNFWWEQRQPFTKLVLDDLSKYWGEQHYSDEFYSRL